MSSYYEKFLATREVKCIDEEIPFEIPATWEWCRLLSIVSLLGDGIHGTPEYSEGGSVYFINGNNLFDGQILIKPDTKTVSKEEAVKHSRLLNESTVLVSINGTIGNIAFYSGENVILGKSACYFNLLNGIERKYIKIVLQTDYFLEYTNDNVNNLLERYFTQLYELAVDNRFDTLAHITYPLRYIIGNVTKEIKYDTYKQMIDEVLKVIIKNDKALEINTSGLRQKIGITLPSETIISRFKELGGKYITIGSDAHRWGDVGSGLETGYEIAEKCGFSYVTVFEKRQPVLLPIN